MGYQFWCYDHAKLLEYIKDTLRSIRMWKDNANDEYKMGFLTTTSNQSGKFGQNGSVG